ncbi:MAG: protein kinase, partial [Anaerolineae bacterium]|nr:protein kinase [Anaerolineae bacterium]
MSDDGQLTPTTGGSTQTKVKGGWLQTTRVIWVLLTLFYVSMFIYGLVTNHFYTIENPVVWDSDWSAEEMRTALAEANIAVETFAGLLTGTYFFPFIINLAIGLLIFWRRSDTWIGLIASFAVIGMGITSSSAWYFGWENLFTTIIVPSTGIELSQGITIATFFTSLGQVSALTMLMTFPNGQFSPKWTRWVMLVFIVYYFAEILSPQNLQSWGSIFGVVITLAQIGVPAYSQVYRFRNAKSIVVRQQIKWLAFSLVGMFVLFAVIIAISASQPETIEPSGGAIRALIIINFLSYTPILLLPASIGIAILRYRLWDIDIVINRSLVYGLVTVTLGTVFLATFGGIQAVLRELVGAEQALYPAVLAGALVAGLFSPTRRMLRRFVDRRFYGIELDYTEAARQEEELANARAQDEAVSSFGKYKALGLIGRGGMGEVFNSEDPDTGETVAIKTLYIRGEGNKDELVKRFHREAQAIEELQHDNIVKLFDYGEEGEVPYMVMEYRYRFLSTSLGRFPQPDSIIPSFSNPQSLNRYSYTLNNPVKYTDPTGHKVEDDIEAPAC